MIVLTVCWRKFVRQENSPHRSFQRKMSAQELGNFTHSLSLALS